MARDPQADADRILAALDRTTRALDKSSKGQERQLIQNQQTMIVSSNMNKVGTALEAAANLETTANIIRGINPLTGIALLASKGVSKLAGEDSTLGDVAQQAQYAATVGMAATGHPLAVAEAALGAPEALKRSATMPFKVPYRFMKNAYTEGSSAVSEAVGAMHEERGERQAGRTMGAASHAVGMMPGLGAGLTAKALIGGNLVGAATMLAGPLVMKVTESLRNFSEKLHDTNMQFAEFSPGMSAVMAMQEMRDIELGQERGDRRALSAGYLAEGKHQLNKDLGAVEDLFATIKNLGAGFFDRLVSPITGSIGEMANSMTDKINEWAEKAGLEPEEGSKSISKYFNALAEQDQRAKQGRPERLR